MLKRWKAADFIYTSDAVEPLPNQTFLRTTHFTSWEDFDRCQSIEELEALLPNQRARLRGESATKAQQRTRIQLEKFLVHWKVGALARWKIHDFAVRTDLHETIRVMWAEALFGKKLGFALEPVLHTIYITTANLWIQATKGLSARNRSQRKHPASIADALWKKACEMVMQHHKLKEPPPISWLSRMAQPLQEAHKLLLWAALNQQESAESLLRDCHRAVLMGDDRFFSRLADAIREMNDTAASGRSFGLPKEQTEKSKKLRYLEEFVKLAKEKKKLPMMKELDAGLDLSASEASKIRKAVGLNGLPKGGAD